MPIINFLFLILIWSSQGMREMKEHTRNGIGDNIDALIETFSAEEMHGMIEIIEFLKLKNPSHESAQELANSKTFYPQESHSASLEEKEMQKLAQLGLSESDIEEIVEIAKVMKVPNELGRIIGSSSEDEVIELSEMTHEDLKMLDKKLTMSELSNKKVVTRRDAQPEPQPPKLLADFYHPYAVSRMRMKRAKSDFKLRLKGKGFGKGRYNRKNPLRKHHSFVHQPESHLMSVTTGGTGRKAEDRSYGMVGEHRGRYGRELWKSSDEDASDQIVNKVETDYVKFPVPNITRKKRYVMEAVMDMLGMEEEEEEPEEVLYLSAMMDGHKHEVMKTPSYHTPESFKRTMARAKLVKTHP